MACMDCWSGSCNCRPSARSRLSWLEGTVARLEGEIERLKKKVEPVTAWETVAHHDVLRWRRIEEAAAAYHKLTGRIELRHLTDSETAPVFDAWTALREALEK